MQTSLTIVFPIFALILMGYICRKTGVLGMHATTELNRFVVYLALPALLFDITANTTWIALDQPGLIGAFGIGTGIVFLVTLGLRRKSGLTDASIDGLNAAYANVGFIGFPLSLAVFGRSSLASTTIAVIITVCVLFAGAIVLIETGLQTETRGRRIAIKVAGSLAKNPLVAAPVLGALAAACDLRLPGGAEALLHLLGNAASPCALVAMGLFLAQERVRKPRAKDVLLLGCLKLVLHPALVWMLATLVFRLPQQAARIATLLAALPTGTGPFMLAELYRRETGITSTTILMSTIASLLTVSLVVAWLQS